MCACAHVLQHVASLERRPPLPRCNYTDESGIFYNLFDAGRLVR